MDGGASLPTLHPRSRPVAPMARRAATAFLPLLLVPLLGACGASSQTGVQGTESTTRVRGLSVGGREPELELRTESTANERVFEARPADVWDALVETYREMEIPITEEPRPRSLLRTVNLRLSRIDGDRIGRFLDCGSGISGERASSWDVRLSLVTSLEPEGEGALIVTDLDARARPRGTSGSSVQCRSRGELERRLFNGVTLRLLGAAGF